MPSVEVERRFAAPIEAVWKVYTDHARWREWAGFSESRLEVAGDPEPNGTGAVRAFGSAGITTFEEILDFEPPNRMTYRVLRGGLPMKNHSGEVRFATEDGGTRVTWRCGFDSRVPGLGWPMERFITRFFRKALDGLATHAFPDLRS